MRFHKYITAVVLMGVYLMSSYTISQETFTSREGLNNYIFQNSDLESITDGYFLEFNPDFTPELQDSFFKAIESEVELGKILSSFKIMEDADVTSGFEMDSILFPIMDRLYANNGISPIAIPLFICDIKFNYLNSETYNEFSNWSSTEPFPELIQNDLLSKQEVITGLFADTLTNQNIKFYWNSETYFSNTNRFIQDVYVVIDGDSLRLEQNRIYDLKNYFTGTLTSIDISIQFDDGTTEYKTNKLFFTNGQEKNDCAEQFGFTGNDRPWSSLGGLCKWGVDTLHNNTSEDFPYLDMNFSVLWGCGGPKVLDKPYIAVTGWGPYTDKDIINSSQGWPSSIEDAYSSYNQEGFIDNLVEAGFDVIIVKLQPPNQSVLKNAILIERLIKMVNEEKFANGSYEENIISGYSAGAMSVRLALQRMEKGHLEGTNEHHHSKLFVSYDGEHGGANVPLALQHLVEHLEKNNLTEALLNQFLNPVPVPPATVWTIENYFNIYALHYILNAALSKELLKYFYTETGTSLDSGQGSDPERTAYLQYHDWNNHFKNTHNPGYPAFTRNISISNGTSQSNINFPVHNHYPFPSEEGKLIFKHELTSRKWEASFLGNSSATPWVYKFEERFLWGQWDIKEEARVHNPLILDNAPGGTTFLSKASQSNDPNITYQVLRSMEINSTPPLQNEADQITYEALYTFTPTILTHDIRNFDPSLTGGRLNYDMKAEGLMYDNLMDADIGNPNDASSFYGYPHLAHPQDHYDYTPFDAVFAWDEVNTVHIQSGEAEFNPDGNDGRGKWEQIHSPVRGVIKNFIVDETDFYNAFIQNRSYGWNAREDFEYKAKIVAWNEIYAGQNVTQRTDFKPAEILENANISFKACKSVNLKSGFHAKSGSEFHAQATSSACGCGGSKSIDNSSGNNEYVPQEKTDVLQFEEKAVNSLDISIYPNPGKDKVNLQVNDEKVHNFEYLVFDLQGKQIVNELVKGTFTTIKLEKGIYVVKIKIGKEWHTRKLIMY